ncbi:MAG: methyltransferase domain-containing protein, partial [Woeseia sp.]
PEASLGEWQNRLHLALQTLAHEVQRLKDALGDKDLPLLARRRLELLMSATEQHRKQVRELLAPIGIQSLQAEYTTHLALRTRLPGDQGLNTYYNNVHRDWCWGEAENSASVEQILDVLGASESHDAMLGDTVVLGAGAGRLAYDLHQLSGTAKTVAVDFNPLLLIIAQSITRGDRIDLYEFPIAPRSLDDSAVLRTLSAPEPARDDFFLVFGDVLRPPFAAAAFDTVVTPWLIDIITEDLPSFAARVNRLLKPGGRWLNFGSLSFEQQTDRRRRYSSEEVLELVGQAGFGPPEVREATIPYMCSPASRHGRRETVFTFCAEKLHDTKNPARHKALPDWLVTGREPVPLLPS